MRIAVCSFLLLVSALPLHAQGRLANVRQEVREGAVLQPAPPATTTEKAAENPDESRAGSILDTLFGGLFAVNVDLEGEFGTTFKQVLFAPYYFPKLALNDSGRQHLSFTPYPYFGVYSGYQILPTADATRFYENGYHDIPRQNWALQTSVDNGNDFRGLNRVGVQVRVDHASRFGIAANWNWFHEKLTTGGADEVLIGDANLTYRFARNEIASMYAGLGVRTLSDRQRTDLGVNFTYGGDWFPVRPFVISTVFDAGTLGSTGVVHGRGTIGVIHHRFEFFGGYDFLRIGSTNLQGPLLGMRLWF